MTTHAYSDIWHQILAWCECGDWISLFITGSTAMRHHLNSAPQFTGPTTSYPALSHFRGLQRLPLIQQLPPAAAMSFTFSPVLTTFCYQGMSYDAKLLQALPPTITSLFVSIRESSSNFPVVELDAIPLCVSSLSLKMSSQVQWSYGSVPITRSALQSLELSLPAFNSYTMYHLISTAPNLTSFTCNRWIPPKDEEEAPLFINPKLIKLLDITIPYGTKLWYLGLLKHLQQFPHARIRLDYGGSIAPEHGVAKPLPHNVVALRCSTVDPALLPVSLTELTITSNVNFTNEAGLVHLTSLTTLSLAKSREVMVPSSVTRLTHSNKISGMVMIPSDG